MSRNKDLQGYLTTVVVFTVAYVVTGMIGLAIQTGHHGITPIWPPSGIALYAFYRYGNRMWPVIGIGIAVLAWQQGIPPLSATIAGAGNIAEAWLGCYLIRNYHIRIGRRFSDAWRFLLLPVLLAPLSAATLGTFGMALGGAVPWSDVSLIWFMWWLGDVCGIMLFFPLLVSWWHRPKRWSTQLRLAEWLVVVTSSMLVGWYTFHGIQVGEYQGAHHLQFLVMPFLLWAAIRLGMRGTTLVSLIACSWVLWEAASASGPFAMDDSVAMGMMESSFILVITLTGLIVQGLFRGHSLDMVDIRYAHDKLEERVRERTAELEYSNERLHQEIREKDKAEQALKKSEQQLYTAKEAAELANKSKSRFLAAASHDLRQPVQAISSYTDFLAINNTDPEIAGSIQKLGNATLAMHELLEGLLDISKLDTGAIRTEINDFSVNTILSQLHEQFQHMATKNGTILKLVPSAAIVRSDATLLRVILQNFISNAIKYSQHGKVIVGCRYRGDQLRIEVWDNGIGIHESEQKAVFEEFYQVENPVRDRNKGVGIGLAIVKRLATLLHYPLYMHSLAGKGSCFAIQVPLIGNAREEMHTAQPVVTRFENDAKAGSILLIEDDEIVLHANHSLLKTLGYEVIPASDAETAMQWVAASAQSPGIIISDYRLPGDYNGAELIQLIRISAGSMIPAIILTGDISVCDADNQLPDSCLWLQKPARVEELLQAINKLLGAQVPSGG